MVVHLLLVFDGSLTAAVSSLLWLLASLIEDEHVAHVKGGLGLRTICDERKRMERMDAP